MRVATISGADTPYVPFGTFASMAFWPGGLTLLAAEPGAGKTSWLLRMVYDAARNHFPAAIGCYEHTEQELKFRLQRQSAAAVAGPHGNPEQSAIEQHLSMAGNAVLLELSSQDDTVRGIEERLLMDFSFPQYGPALVAVDYIQRVPVIGLTGILPEDIRAGEAAAKLRELGRKHGWAIIAATALRSDAFSTTSLGLGALLGDERLAYEADRIVFLSRADGNVMPCGCFTLKVSTRKDRTGALKDWTMEFWGAHFYPAIGDEIARYRSTHG